jgi:heat shock protein HslJ
MRRLMMTGLIIIAVMLSTVCKTVSGQEKKAHATAAATSSAAVQLVGNKWKLIELHGQAVVKKPKSKEDPYLRFTRESTVSAYTGCNNMTCSYQVSKGSQIKFSNITSTKMACADMQTELILNQVLQTADNFTVKGKRMTLGKTGMETLAVFVAEDAK